MIQLWGSLSLVMALVFALLQCILPLYGFYRRHIYSSALARPFAIAQSIFVIAAYVLLTSAFAFDDFSIAYVAQNSSASLPFFYKITAVFGGHEGSILLWVLLLNGWSIAYSVAAHKENRETVSLVLAIFGFICSAFLFFLLLTSNPFLPASVLASGVDLNPLLQDPGLVIHPPLLYIGYVGFVAAFAITQAALLRGKLDCQWANMTRRFTSAAWCFLTAGICLGSWWAYRILGWGGFWFWDPVENVSLLPWLSGTALIHVLVLAEKRGIAKNWAALLAIMTFTLSLLGTFLVRSGVLISAHTFANDPKRGIFLLSLLAILLTLSLAIYLIRMPALKQFTVLPFTWLSREMGLLLNSIFLFTVMATILAGTLYPLLLDIFQLGAVSVGAPYFNMVMTPFLFFILALMGLGPLCRWQKQSFAAVWQPVWKKVLLSLTLVLSLSLSLSWYCAHYIDNVTIIGLFLCVWVVLCVIYSVRLLPGMALAHTGFAIFAAGILLSSLLSIERDVRIKPGDMVKVGPYQFFFLDTQGISGPNYRGLRADIEVIRHHRHITTLYPEKRIYTIRQMVMTKTAIQPGIFRDLYVALGEPLEQNNWSARFYYKPFVRWIWFGGIIMMLGGFTTLIQRKRPLT